MMAEVSLNSNTVRLVSDALRRGRLAWFSAGVFLVATWASAATAHAPAEAGVAVSLIAVFILGPVIALSTLMMRETRFLPLTSREVWVASWVLSTGVATLFVVSLHAVGIGIGLAAGYAQPTAVESMGFVAVCTLAYGGALLPVGPLLGYAFQAASERRPTWLWGSLAMLMLIIYTGGLVAPWAAWSWLPTSLADLTWTATAVLVVGMLAAVAALAWTPSRFGGMRHVTNRQAHPPTAGPRSAAHPGIRRADRLTGVSRMLLPTLGWVFVLSLVATGGAAAYVERTCPR